MTAPISIHVHVREPSWMRVPGKSAGCPDRGRDRALSDSRDGCRSSRGVPQCVDSSTPRPAVSFLPVPIDVDLNARERGPAPRPDVLEDELMGASSAKSDAHHPRGTRTVAAKEIRRSFTDDFGFGVRIHETPDVPGRGMVLNVDCEDIVRAGFERRSTVGCGERPHVGPGIRRRYRRRQALLQGLDRRRLELFGFGVCQDVGGDQRPARGLVADTQT